MTQMLQPPDHAQTGTRERPAVLRALYATIEAPPEGQGVDHPYIVGRDVASGSRAAVRTAHETRTVEK